MRVLSLSLAALSLPLVLGACAGLESPRGIVAPGAKFEEVSRSGIFFAEGVVAARNGMVYLSDLTRTAVIRQNNPGGTIYRFDPATGATSKFMEPSGMSNGLHVDRNGDLLIAQDADTGGRAVVRRNLATGKISIVADRYEGKRLNSVNDVTSDAQGRIYFTDARYGGAEPMELPNAVYRVDPDGRITRLSTDVFRPNGIEVSPDGRRLYVSAANVARLPTNPNGPAKDRFGISTGGVVAYDLDANGNVSNGRLFYRNDELMTDGMAVDTEGNLYIALHNGLPKEPRGDVIVLAPDGRMIERIALPGAVLATNLGFGRGADENSLYLTTAVPWRLYRIKTLRRGLYF